MSTHTPGPWEFSGGAIFGTSPLNARVRLADIIFHNRLNRIDAEANGHLMAAAPDLFSAISQMNCADGEGYCICPLKDGTAPDHKHATVCADARAAITKATGAA